MFGNYKSNTEYEFPISFNINPFIAISNTKINDYYISAIVKLTKSTVSLRMWQTYSGGAATLDVFVFTIGN